MEERLDLIHKLQRKYGGSIEGGPGLCRKARQELEMIAHATERIAEMELQEAALLVESGSARPRAVRQRKEAALRLEQGVERR